MAKLAADIVQAQTNPWLTELPPQHDHIIRLELHILATEQLLRAVGNLLAVPLDYNLDWIGSAIVIRSYHRLGESQINRPSDQRISNLANDGNGWPALEWCLPGHLRCRLLPGEKSGTRPSIGLTLGNATGEKDRQNR